MGKTIRQTGKIGRYLYAIVQHTGALVSICYSRWEAAYMMRENNGKGRTWRVVRYEAKP